MTPGPAEALPQLEIVRQTAAMRRIFEIAMPDQNIRKCSVLLVRYKPGKRCMVSYRLTMAKDGAANDGASAPASQILSARFYPPGDSLSRFVKAQRDAVATPAFGMPIFHVPDLDAVVWAFPNDPKLRGVPALIDEQRIAREVLPVLMNRVFGREIRVGPLSLEVVRYIPEHGCTVKLTAYPDGEDSPVVFYGKTYCGEEGEQTYRNMSALWNSEARTGGALRMAQPLAYEPAHFILWQSAVEGPTLASFEKSGPGFLPYLRAAGRAAVALHSQLVPGLPRMTTAQLCCDLQVAERHLRRVPTLAGRVSRLTSQLLEQAREFGAGRAATLHGDLHAKNIIFPGGTFSAGPAALIDLDNLSAGDPLQDLGSFVASTCARALDNNIAAADIAPMIAAVVRGYEESAAWQVPRAALRWQTAAALMAEQAHRTVIRLKIAKLDGLVDVAQQALSGEGHMKVLL